MSSRKRSTPSRNDEELIEAFVAAWPVMTPDAMSLSPVSQSPARMRLATGEFDPIGYPCWRPLRQVTPPDALAPLEARLPGPLPPLYRRLVLTYRWDEIDLGPLRLLANPPGADLSLLENEMTGDGGMWAFLSARALIQFGKGPDLNYDPVCFDTRALNSDGDYPLVQFDHEAIICNSRLRAAPFGSLYGGQGRPAPASFRELVHDLIAAAGAKRNEAA